MQVYQTTPAMQGFMAQQPQISYPDKEEEQFMQTTLVVLKFPKKYSYIITCS